MVSNKLIIYSFLKSVPNPESYAIIRIIIRNITRGNVSVATVLLQYSDGIAKLHIEDPFLFWKENGTKYPELSKLAEKFLGVPASEADVKRMFNISGFIFNPKRRSLCVDNYEILVILKLNETYL